MRDKKELREELRKKLENKCDSLEKQRRSQLSAAESGCSQSIGDIKHIDKEIRKLRQKIKETF